MTGRRAYGFMSNRLLVALIAALVMTLGWTALAYAQTSAGTQYGSRTASGEAAIHGVSAASTSGGPAMIGVLPNTGGPMIPFAVLGGLALCTIGLLVIRRLRTNN